MIDNLYQKKIKNTILLFFTYFIFLLGGCFFEVKYVMSEREKAVNEYCGVKEKK